MKNSLFFLLVTLFSCTTKNTQQPVTSVQFTKAEILKELDLAAQGIPSPHFPAGKYKDVKYNFFLDLEHGYCVTASSKIHLYGDAKHWAIVFEKSGYQNRGQSVDIQLHYVGNCINYPIDKYPERNYITNTNSIELITPDELERIESTEGTEEENFELIGSEIKEINIRNNAVRFENDYKKYERLGISIRDFHNPHHRIDFGSIARYFNETDPEIISATEDEIKEYLPSNLPKLLTLDQFHYTSLYQEDILPSQQETYQLLAKVLVNRNPKFWQPTLKANNHWSNWESGHL